MKFKRVEHVAIAVRDMDRMRDVFENKLGIAMEYEEHLPRYATTLAMYPVGETYLEVLQSDDPGSETSRWIDEKGEGLFHICLEVEDIDAALAELREKDVKLIDETPRIGHGGARIAFLDPEATGNLLIELAELPPAGTGRRPMPDSRPIRVLVTDRHTRGDEYIERDAAGPDVELEFFDHHDDVTDEAWARADGIVTYRGAHAVTAAAAKLRRARIVVRGGVGFDGLDLKALGERDIAVCTVPDYGTTEVADHAIALMLALRRGLDRYDERMRRDPAGLWRYVESPCVDRLRGRTFGVLGLGRIGFAAARRAAAFDMEVVFYDPYLPDGSDLSTGYTRLSSPEALFEAADTVSLHAPLTEETHGIVNADRLARMKPGAVLVNTSRGAVVDLDALYGALRAGRPAGAALDVLPDEPADDSHPLVRAYMAREEWLEGRLMVTPHAAFYSPPGLVDLRSKAVATAAARVRDGTLRNCQNTEYLP